MDTSATKEPPLSVWMQVAEQLRGTTLDLPSFVLRIPIYVGTAYPHHHGVVSLSVRGWRFRAAHMSVSILGQIVKFRTWGKGRFRCSSWPGISPEDFSPAHFDYFTLQNRGENADQDLRILGELWIPNSNTADACQEFVNRIEPYSDRTPNLMAKIYGDAFGERAADRSVRRIKKRLGNCCGGK